MKGNERRNDKRERKPKKERLKREKKEEKKRGMRKGRLKERERDAVQLGKNTRGTELRLITLRLSWGWVRRMSERR